jgi:hypothetical protein
MTTRKTRHTRRSPATPGVHQLAARVARQRKGSSPAFVALEPIEQRFLRLLLADYRGSTQDAGAAVLLLRRHMLDLTDSLPAHRKNEAPGFILNLLSMIGEALYTGRLPASYDCPHPLPGDIPCPYLCEAPDQQGLEIYMRAHMSLHHPDLAWHPASLPTPRPPANLDFDLRISVELYQANPDDDALSATATCRLGHVNTTPALDLGAWAHDHKNCAQPDPDAPTTEATDV